MDNGSSYVSTSRYIKNADQDLSNKLESTVAMHTFKIEERRRKVACLIAQSFTEEEIAQQLKVNQSTISRDIKALKQMSQQFVYDLARSELAYCYKQCINGIEEVKKSMGSI
jgi:DNA-binding NarL/FixJ family response regulator